MAKYKYTEHPAIVVIEDKPFLRVFEDPFIEENLPKWKKAVEASKVGPDTKMANFSGAMDEDPMETATMRPEDSPQRQHTRTPKMAPAEIVRSAKWDRERYIRNLRVHMNRLAKVKYSLARWVIDRLPGKKEEDARVAFEEIKKKFVCPTTADIQKAKLIVDTVANDMDEAGQYVKAEQLRDAADIAQKQVVLSQKGYSKYLTEEQVVEFLLKAERGVMVDYLRFYSEILPKEVVEKKKAADELMIFDNYVIIYYDDGVDLFRRHSEENLRAAREKRRDPILCGVIRGCRKLFYVTDWTTATDDLTIEVVEKSIGHVGVLPKFDDPEVTERRQHEADLEMRDMDSLLQSLRRSS